MTLEEAYKKVINEQEKWLKTPPTQDDYDLNDNEIKQNDKLYQRLNKERMARQNKLWGRGGDRPHYVAGEYEHTPDGHKIVPTELDASDWKTHKRYRRYGMALAHNRPGKSIEYDFANEPYDVQSSWEALHEYDDLREYMTPEQAFIELRNRGYSKADIDFIKKQINHGVIIAQNQKGASTGQA